ALSPPAWPEPVVNAVTSSLLRRGEGPLGEREKTSRGLILKGRAPRSPSPLNGERAGVRGEIAHDAIRFRNANSAKTDSPTQVVEKLLGIFGPQHLFVEIQRHHLRNQHSAVKALPELAAQYK